MPVEVESVGDSEGQSQSQLQSVRLSRWGLLLPVGWPLVETVGDSEGQSESQLQSVRTPRWGALLTAASGWATLAEKQKCSVGLEDSTACYGQEKKLWVNMAICLSLSLSLSCLPPPFVCLRHHRGSTPYERIKRHIYIYIYIYILLKKCSSFFPRCFSHYNTTYGFK